MLICENDNMYTVHILQKLPIAWQIYPDSPKVNAVITDLVQDLEEDLIAPPHCLG